MAAECASFHKREIMMYGFGIPGQGFYSMEIPYKGDKAQHGGLIVVQEGEATEEKLEEELKNLVKAYWNLQVRQATRVEFRAIFPDQGSLETFSKLSKVVLAIHGLRVKISKSTIDPAASSVLQSAWVKIIGVPSFAREEEIIKEITALVAEPVKVDEFSLLRDEPVRVRVNCRDPSKLRGFVEIFFNGVGYEIKFQVEGNQGNIPKLNDSHLNQGRSDDRERKNGGHNLDRDRNMFKGRDSNNHGKSLDRNGDASQGDSQDDSMEDLIKDGSPEVDLEPHASLEPITADISMDNDILNTSST